MNWRRRQYRAGERPEQPYLRRAGYETVKEGTGNLLQQAGTALGALIGLLAGKWGMPPTASVITGAVVGNTLGSVGKGFIAAAVDQVRERRIQRAAAREGARAGGAGVRRSTGHGASGIRRSRAGRDPQAAEPQSRTPSPMSQVLIGLEQAIEQFAETSRRLNDLAAEMRRTQAFFMAILHGARPDFIDVTRARLSTSNVCVDNAAGLLMTAAKELKDYRSSI